VFVRSCHRAAITAQQSCSIDDGKNLIGRDGISKTMVWKKCAPSGNFADAKTFPLRHAGADRKMGLLFIHDRKKETDRCASRRLLR
jgi:hypothetical protein